MLKGHVFKEQKFGNEIFALFIDTFLAGHCGVINGYKNSMGVSYSGSNVTVASGAVCIKGRFLEEDSSTPIDAGTNTLFCKLVLEIDLDKENTSSQLNQASYKIITGANDYPSLTQDNIVGTNSGVYQYELARFKTGISGITNFTDSRTFLDFDSIYEELETQSNIVFKDELASVLADYVTNSGLSDTLANYLSKSGGTLTGNLNARHIAPSSSNTYNLGSSTALWKQLWVRELQSTYTRIYNSGEVSIFGVFNSASFRSQQNVNTFMPISASAFNVNSSKRYKKNIEKLSEEEANKILDVDVVKFDYKNEENGTGVVGVIAEDVYKILPNVVTTIKLDGEQVPDSVDYSKFVPYLMKKIQMLEKEVQELRGGTDEPEN